jgi:hypothetical protein
MVKFKQSFNELNKPLVWAHYAVGTILLWALFKFIFQVQFISQLNLKEVAIFYFAYVLLDRISHGVLGLV